MPLRSLMCMLQAFGGATALIDVYSAGFVQVMLTQQMANPDQDLGFAA